MYSALQFSLGERVVRCTSGTDHLYSPASLGWMSIKIHLILGVFGVYSSFFEKKSSKVTNSSCDNMNLQYSERKPHQLLYTSEYMKDYIFELWGNKWRHDWSLHLCTQLKQTMVSRLQWQMSDLFFMTLLNGSCLFHWVSHSSTMLVGFLSAGPEWVLSTSYWQLSDSSPVRALSDITLLCVRSWHNRASLSVYRFPVFLANVFK